MTGASRVDSRSEIHDQDHRRTGSRHTQFDEIPGVVGRLEQARDEQTRFRIWLGLASFFLGAIGIVALFHVDRLDVGRARLGPGAGSAGRWSAWRLSDLVRSRRPYSSPQAAADAEALSRSWASGFERFFNTPSPASHSPCRPRPGCFGHWSARPISQTAALDFRKLIPWPIFERRAIGLFLASIVGGGRTLRKSVAANRRPADAAPARSLHHDAASSPVI